MSGTSSQIKPHARVLGVAEAPFDWDQDEISLVGVVVSLPGYVESIYRTTVTVDGTDATSRVEELIRATGWPSNLTAVMVKGASLAGFNMLDSQLLFEKTGIPLVTFSREPPDLEEIQAALQEHFNDWRERLAKLEAIPPREYTFGEMRVHCSVSCMEPSMVQRLLELSTVKGGMPEPLRLARLVARTLAGPI